VPRPAINESAFDDLCARLCLAMPSCVAIQIGNNSAAGEVNPKP
jgi:hypothetical protein